MTAEKRARVFLLSPAFSGGRRAQVLLSERAQFDLALRLRAGQAELGEVFSFLSGLYFRGKLAYARAFVRPLPQAEPASGILVITAGDGLVRADSRVDPARMRAFEQVAVSPSEPRFRVPLERDARALAERLGEGQAVLLGSIATGKYVDVLLEAFGSRLVFPPAFVGRGDLSRGGLLLRCAEEGRQLDYLPVSEVPLAARRGARPPRLPPRGHAGR